MQDPCALGVTGGTVTRLAPLLGQAPSVATTPHLEFERDIVDLEGQIQKLLDTAERRDLDVSEELSLLRNKLLKLREDTFHNLTPMEQVQVARHPRRPYTRWSKIPLLVSAAVSVPTKPWTDNLCLSICVLRCEKQA